MKEYTIPPFSYPLAFLGGLWYNVIVIIKEMIL